jgi:hypothetical protein
MINYVMLTGTKGMAIGGLICSLFLMGCGIYALYIGRMDAFILTTLVGISGLVASYSLLVHKKR